MNTLKQKIQPKPYPGLAQAIGLTAIFFGITIFISILFVAASLILGWQQNQTSNLLIKFFGYIIPIGAVILLGKTQKTKYERSNKNFRFPGVKLSIYPLLFLIAFAFTLFTEPIVNLIPIPDFIKTIFEKAFSTDFLTLILIVIIAPIMEELLFRGIILDGFLKIYSPAKAIIWSSLLFGAIHLNPWQFIPAVAIGILMGWVYWKTKSLLPCIFIHFSTNLIGALMILMANDPTASIQQLLNKDILYYSLIVISIAITILGFKVLNKTFQSNKSVTEEIIPSNQLK